MKRLAGIVALLPASMLFTSLLFVNPLAAQTPTGVPSDPFKALGFLEGTWEAKTAGHTEVSASGSYSFRAELGNHILARHSLTGAGCKGPADFDCDHGDLLYIYQDAPGEMLKAIYFDNEGHVIHYTVSTPTSTSVVFLSDGSQPGPQFRLMYELKGGVMSGKFQVRPPGQTEFRSYLEWSGAKRGDTPRSPGE